MLGFLIGTVCLVLLVKLLRTGCHERAFGGCGRAHGWGHPGGYDRGGWGSRRGGRAFWLRGLFERLDTSPGQEKVIKQSAEELFEATRGLRGEFDQSRHDVAQALRSGAVDETAMGELFARHDDKLRELRKIAVGALAKISDALDEDQRKDLADMLERGGYRSAFRGGPYRSA